MAKKENRHIDRKGGTKLPEEIPEIIELTFRSPDSGSVFVAGDFNGWDTRSLPMKKDKDGIWKLKVKLPPGRYEYKLFADNAWVEDLPDLDAVSNPFGTRNYVVSVR